MPVHDPPARGPRRRRPGARLLLAWGALACAPRPAAAPPEARAAAEPAPLVIAHRGASAHRPEHTLAAYALASALGADYVEPDLVRTRDGVLVARHENEIGGTTDAAARFPGRRATRTVDGAAVTGWFVEDFTLAELRTLRARERLPALRPTAHDGRHPVPTFDEVLALAARLGRARGRPLGVYPELKHPAHFRALGLPLEEPLAAALRARGLDRADAPVLVQSFDPASLRRLRGMTRARLVQLVDAPGVTPHDTLLAPAGLAAVARYAYAVAVDKQWVQPVDSAGALGAPTTLVRDAHAAGLRVHVWTLRPEAPFLPAGYGGDARAEWRRLAALGVDGLFGDAPDQGVAALRR